MTKPTDRELENRFLPHRLGPAQIDACAEVTTQVVSLAKQLRDLCPEGRNLSLALTHLEDVKMRANMAIACDTLAPTSPT